MAVRNWSFTRLWVFTTAYWFLAVFVKGTGHGRSEREAAAFVALGIALIPAFLAGSWAGTHHEIRDWPKIRLYAMWVATVAVACFADLSEVLVLSAPVAILSVRWFEFNGGRPAWRFLLPRSRSAETISDPITDPGKH